MDKDRTIITQVCAKIAAELVNLTGTTEEKMGEFAILFSSVKDMVFETLESDKDMAPIVQLQQGFQGSTIVSDGGQTQASGPIQIVGKQHGDLPDWLIVACKRDGTTKVYDNRDGLAINPKRPWFKAVEGDKAYWAPKTGKFTR
jgi:hypothetical protein